MMQVEGGLAKLHAKTRAGGMGVLFHGASSLLVQAFLGHYCWYGTYNVVDARLTTPPSLAGQLGRNAAVGFMASAVSDTATNSLRVLKTYKQTSEAAVTYREVAEAIVRKEGVTGLLGRGLTTRLIANGVQAALFSAAWKYLDKQFMGQQQHSKQQGRYSNS